MINVMIQKSSKSLQNTLIESKEKIEQLYNSTFEIDKDDVTIYDRVYPSYELFVQIDRESNYAYEN